MSDGVVLTDEAWELLQPLLRHVRRHGLWAPPVNKPQQNNTLPPPAYVHNDSGEEIPPYACMQVTGTEEIDGQNYLVVDKPADTDGTSGGYVFNGPFAIADDDEGKYQVGQVVRGYKDSGTITGGDKWSPVVNQWYIAKVNDGPFIACGADDVDDDVLKVFSTGISSTGVQPRIYRTPGGGIAARTTASLPSATCTRVTVTSGTRTVTTDTETVYNDFTSAIAGSVDIVAAYIDGEWVAIAEDCSA